MECSLNKKYSLLRHCVVSAFACDKFREINDVDVSDFPEMMKFVKDMYYNYFKYIDVNEKEI